MTTGFGQLVEYRTNWTKVALTTLARLPVILLPGLNPGNYSAYVGFKLLGTLALQLYNDLWRIRLPCLIENSLHYLRFVILLNLFQRVISTELSVGRRNDQTRSITYPGDGATVWCGCIAGPRLDQSSAQGKYRTCASQG